MSSQKCQISCTDSEKIVKGMLLWFSLGFNFTSLIELELITTLFTQELGTHFATDSHDDFSLMDLETYLKKQVEDLQHSKEQRLKYTQELLSKVTRLYF